MVRIATLLTLALLVFSGGAASAQSRVEIGVLSCRGPTTSFILGSVTELSGQRLDLTQQGETPVILSPKAQHGS